MSIIIWWLHLWKCLTTYSVDSELTSYLCQHMFFQQSVSLEGILLVGREDSCVLLQHALSGWGLRLPQRKDGDAGVGNGAEMAQVCWKFDFAFLFFWFACVCGSWRCRTTDLGPCLYIMDLPALVRKMLRDAGRPSVMTRGHEGMGESPPGFGEAVSEGQWATL